MSESAAARLGPAPLAAAVEAAPDGVAIFDTDWTVRYVNPAGARLLQRAQAELVDRNLWIALPELGRTIQHSFLLPDRSVGTAVSWQGSYPPAGRWLSVTAVLVGDLLQVYFRPAGRWLSVTAVLVGDLLQVYFRPRTARHPERPDQADVVDTRPGVGDGDDDVDADRLRFLAEVSEALIGELDTRESAARLAELVVSRLADWAIVALLEDGRPGEEAWAHRDPARRADLDAYMRGRILGTAQNTPLAAALLTGEPVQLTALDPALVEPSLPTEEVRAAWERLEASSCSIVPLRARAETFGALAL
ncbi:PAS domain-containing protein [Blastococcus mobilis]|uniref:PAS fold-containing protein n=1 Tax=Blastococcus mobilis TaxID=1938746 RepID=A0A238ZG06_9ACTN|nr:PAS domain-containing protein [Blastococcus mobilis]SNR82210.1 PAS fold-containing protein [Blastococcus mobilis]